MRCSTGCFPGRAQSGGRCGRCPKFLSPQPAQVILVMGITGDGRFAM